MDGKHRSESRFEMNLQTQVPRVLTTKEAAALIRRAPQTLRQWASAGNGLLQPVQGNRSHGAPLLWYEADVIALLENKRPAKQMQSVLIPDTGPESTD